MKYFWTRYLFSYPGTLLYMLQNTEYRLAPYVAWFNRTDDFRSVMKRRGLDMTNKVRLLAVFMWTVLAILYVIALSWLYMAISTMSIWWLLGALGLVLSTPFILGYGIIVPLFIGWVVIQKPKERAMIRRAKNALTTHTGRRIAIAGSYGKTTAKELLLSILAEGKKVAATPGNMNTAIGISRFVNKLKGNEEVLIFELGEEKVGDVRKLSELTQPDFGVITGINEAHLSSFKTLERTVGTIFELADFVADDKLYVNKESQLVREHAKDTHKAFGAKGVDGWEVTDVSTSIKGTQFTMTKGDVTVNAETALIGKHTVGITAAAIAIASELGVSPTHIEKGLRKLRPFEHRMELRSVHGASVIDDTYNGNSEGVKVGLAFLAEVEAKRRVYVTPGLVEQGDKTKYVHEKIGEQAAVSADVVVLMKNSVTEYIKTGLRRKNFKGKLVEIDDPLEFYTHLEHFVAVGDIVLMQNDWTDNYQ